MMWVTCCILVLWLWAEGGQILRDTTTQKTNSYHHGNLRCYNTESALTVRVCGIYRTLALPTETKFRRK